jgi:RNA recognition motif-containing protein
MNIFVAKLGRNVTAEDLQHHFSTFGEVVSAKVVADRFTGVSKGYGFVEMASEEDGENAINSLNESVFMENTIVVKRAHPREEPVERKRHIIIKKKVDAPEPDADQEADPVSDDSDYHID